MTGAPAAKLEALIAGAEEDEEIGLAGLVGLFELLRLLDDEREERVAGIAGEIGIGLHLTAGGIRLAGDLFSESFGFEALALGGGGFFGDLTLVAIPEGQRDGETKADKAGVLTTAIGLPLVFAGGEEACADILHALGFGEIGIGLCGGDLGLGELEVRPALPGREAGHDEG